MRRNRRHTGIIVGILAGTLAFLAVIQVRSQAEVARSLESQDNTSLAFLIDELHNANDQLSVDASTLQARRDALQRNQNAPLPLLSSDAERLRIIDGLAPAAGPGVTISASAPLTALDLQDAANNLRMGGAEALAINGQRVTTNSVIVQDGDTITIDGQRVEAPWSFEAIGNPGTLQPAAEAMASSLRADPRVRSANYAAVTSLTINAVVRPRPFVYATT